MKKIYKNLQITFYCSNDDIMLVSGNDLSDNFGSVNDFVK